MTLTVYAGEMAGSGDVSYGTVPSAEHEGRFGDKSSMELNVDCRWKSQNMFRGLCIADIAHCKFLELRHCAKEAKVEGSIES